MSNSQLIIPSVCKVGFNLRSDCYSGKLGYVIYKDNKNIWRKETSWENWRQKEGEKIRSYYGSKEPDKFHGEEVKVLEFENTPRSGFILNRPVGGYKSDWNYRQTYARVWAPIGDNGFEFEITVPNLLYILQETDCLKGKGLWGDFVFSWDKTDLVLLPCCSQDYRKSQVFTQLQTKKITSKELILGATYKTKKEQSLIYLGRMDWSDYGNYYSQFKKNAYIFGGGKDNKQFKAFTSVNSLGECIIDTCCENFADLLESFQKSKYYDPIIKVEFEKVESGDLSESTYYYARSKNEFYYKKVLQPKYFVDENLVEIELLTDGYRSSIKGVNVTEKQKYNFKNFTKKSLQAETKIFKSLRDLETSANLQVCYFVTQKGNKILNTFF